MAVDDIEDIPVLAVGFIASPFTGSSNVMFSNWHAIVPLATFVGDCINLADGMHC